MRSLIQKALLALKIRKWYDYFKSYGPFTSYTFEGTFALDEARWLGFQINSLCTTYFFYSEVWHRLTFRLRTLLGKSLPNISLKQWRVTGNRKPNWFHLNW